MFKLAGTPFQASWHAIFKLAGTLFPPPEQINHTFLFTSSQHGSRLKLAGPSLLTDGCNNRQCSTQLA